MKPQLRSLTKKSSFRPYRFTKRNFRALGLIVAFISLGAVWYETEHYFQEQAREEFEHNSHEHFVSVENRMQNYVHLLRSGIGLFYSSDHVSREEWHDFVEVLDPEKNYPGLQGLGFSQMLYGGEEDRLRPRLREDGFIPYTLGDHSKLQSSILYLEPLDERNRNAIGYDMYSEPTRRAAMDRAARTGTMSISAKVTLVQEIDENIQAGFLIYLPLYSVRDGVSEYSKNRVVLRGFVYSPIRAGDFFGTIPSHHDKLYFSVSDQGESLYNSLPKHQYAPRFQQDYSLEIGGRVWTIRYYSSPHFEARYDTFYPLLISVGSVVLMLTLLSIIFELLRKRIELKQKTREIIDAKRWVERLLNFSADGIHILGGEGKLIGYSPSFQVMLGYDDTQMKTLSVFDWDVKIDPQVLRIIMENLTEEAATFESVFRRQDGSMIDVEVKAHTFYEEGKKYVFASSWDISEQKRSKQELIIEKELAHHYLDIVEVMILIIDTDFTIQLINRKGSEILGYTSEEAVGKNFVELFIPPRQREQLYDVADSNLNYEGYNYFENPIVNKEGKERLIAWRNRVMFDEEGMLKGILSSGEDITELRQIQDHLIERESFYKTIFASVSEAIIILENYFVIDCNDQALSMFESDRTDFIGRYIFQIAHEIECSEKSFVEHVNSAYAGVNAMSECSIRIGSDTNETKIVELNLISFGALQDNKLMMVVRDITHKIEEQRFLTMNARQAQMGEMISMIAHQWRQPLAIINAITSQIRMKAILTDNEDPVLINSLMKIEQQSAHLSQTISEYRDFFHPNKPKERFFVSSLLDNAINLIDHALKNNSIHIDKQSSIDPILFTYRNEMLQVIIVLLKNALDAFSEHKIVDGKIVFSVEVIEDRCIIRVRDNAGGIPPEVMKKIFIPYFTTKPKNGGTGLGLYMSKLIIEDHCGGTLSAMSEGSESTFTIILPYQRESLDDA